jgi:Fe-S cluster assembly ATP-binding protein
MNVLKIDNITVSIEDKIILNEFSLTIKSGEIHAIMGQNGTGKSTLVRIIMGDPSYKLEKGKIYFDDKELSNMTVDERARLGIFLGMQMPTEVDGVTNADFLRTALVNRDGKNFKLYSFIKKLDESVDQLQMSKDMIHRSVNKGFSGGERKKNEILQMKMLEPKIVMLDEIDSGLDVDSLKMIGEEVMSYHQKNKPAIILVTHYKRLLDYIKPDFIHIISDGKIVKSGDFNLAKEIEEEGYKGFKNKVNIDCVAKVNRKNE